MQTRKSKKTIDEIKDEKVIETKEKVEKPKKAKAKIEKKEKRLVFCVIEHTDGSDCGVELFGKYQDALTYAQNSLHTLLENLSGTGTSVSSHKHTFKDDSGQEYQLHSWDEDSYEKSKHIIMTAEYVKE